MTNRIRQLRKENGITTRDFARQMDIALSTLVRWETGENEPDMLTQTKLADFFNVSIDYLTGKTDIREKPEDIIKQFLSPEEYEEQAKGKIVAKNFAEMDEEDQKRLLDYMEVLMRGKKK